VRYEKFIYSECRIRYITDERFIYSTLAVIIGRAAPSVNASESAPIVPPGARLPGIRQQERPWIPIQSQGRWTTDRRYQYTGLTSASLTAPHTCTCSPMRLDQPVSIERRAWKARGSPGASTECKFRRRSWTSEEIGIRTVVRNFDLTVWLPINARAIFHPPGNSSRPRGKRFVTEGRQSSQLALALAL